MSDLALPTAHIRRLIVDDEPPAVVVTTACDELALEAFEAQARRQLRGGH